MKSQQQESKNKLMKESKIKLMKEAGIKPWEIIDKSESGMFESIF